MTDRPDNRASWDDVSAAYQKRLGWFSDRLAWGIRCPFEDELNLLGDVRGRHVLVLGCGGGQDIVALAKMGAGRITGVDVSTRQLEHARDVLMREDLLATTRLIHSSIEDLEAIEDESVDIAVSVHTLNYVEQADACFAETYRVAKRAGVFAFSVQHPADASTFDDPPYGFEKPYFQAEFDWEWKSLGGGSFRSYYRSVGEWFGLLTGAGFAVERLLEPPPSDDAEWSKTGWAEMNDYSKYETVPGTLILGARKPVAE
jgi:ubiquinone/menaquinone biosynthesis C-methylase UbiE